MNKPILLTHGATLSSHPSKSYKSKWSQARYCCTQCRETLSDKPVAYSLRLPGDLFIPARAVNRLSFHFCSEEHARLWFDDQLAQAKARNEARALAYRESLSERKACLGCGQEFPVNEHGYLVVPFFDVHSATCKYCGQLYIIEYEEDGSRISYHCPAYHQFGSSSSMYGWSTKYCPRCNEERRHERSVPCCVCQQKKGFYLNRYHGYTLYGGGTAIRLFCDECEDAFLALSASHQAFYIRSRCNLAFPQGQVIYAMRDPETHLIRYIGRTHDMKKRFQKHLSERSNEPVVLQGGRQYYSRPNWMYDLFSKGWRPSLQVIKEVEIAPRAIEWETRYILHGFQQGWPLVNIESALVDFIAHAKASALDFLNAPFEDLVQEDFFRKDGIEAFIHAYYR